MIPGTSELQEAVGEPRADRSASAAWQFRISSLLWLTFTVAMTLAYGRAFGQRVMLVLMALALVGAGIGLLLSVVSPSRRGDAIYWGVLGALLGGICVVPANLPLFVFWFWPLLGAVVGACAGGRQFYLAGIAAGLMAAVIAAWVWVNTRSPGVHLLLGEAGVDLACVPLAAIALCGLVVVLDRLQARFGTSRDAWAAALVFAVIAGNLWAAHLKN
jgi:hypothetical protein